MIKLSAKTSGKVNYYLEQIIKESEYDMNCYEEGTPEYEAEKDKHDTLLALLYSRQNIAEDRIL